MNIIKTLSNTLIGLSLLALMGCSDQAKTTNNTASTCVGDYPSYFQDPAFSKTGMWDNQVTINQPTADWKGPVFQLSDDYSSAKIGNEQPWQAYNPFDSSLSQKDKQKQAYDYIWAVMNYMQEGNIDSGDVNTDWTLCDNDVRSWFHIPYQTYEPLSGREFVHGLTREAPVTMTLNGKDELKTTMWAVGFYNPAAANSISNVWTGQPDPKMPTQNFKFNDGSVIGKLLFTTATPNEFPFLANVPKWQANISAPEFCGCTPATGSSCTFEEETEQCPRTVSEVYLLQFDIAVRDARSPVGWAYGTFVADGERKASEENPWNRIAALGLMWGNDAPPMGTGAVDFPKDPRKNGLQDGVVFYDAVDMLNVKTNAGHLGCNNRLNGPADNAQSSCLSCHQTASVPDKTNTTPAIMYQFWGGQQSGAGQCETNPSALDLSIDQSYFESLSCSESFKTAANIAAQPDYASGAKEWISTDFSLQLSISLTQWQEWHQDQAKQDKVKHHIFEGVLPGRKAYF